MYWRNLRIVRVLILSLTLGLLVGCISDGRDSVPITTSSEQALEYFRTGRDYAERLRRGEARRYLELALEEDPDFARAHLEMAQVLDNSRQTFEHINEARLLRDKVSPGERLLIDVFVAGANSDYNGQREALLELVDMYPADERVHEMLGNFYYGQQEYEKAIEQYQIVHSLAPQYSQAYNMEGYSERALGRFEKAEQALRKYIELIPDDPNPYDSYADLLMKMGQFDSSIVYYRKALMVDSTFTPSYSGVASNLMLMGKHDAARNESEMLMRRSESPAVKREALRMIAISYVDQLSYDAALDALRRRYDITEETQDFPAQVNDLFVIGTVVLESGKPAEAAQLFQEASKLARRSDLAEPIQKSVARRYLFNMARVALARKDLATAKARFDSFSERVRARKVPSEIKSVHLLAGLIALYERDYDKAVKELSQADRQSPYAMFQMAKALQGRGDLEAAKKLFDKVADFNQTGSLEYALVREEARRLGNALSVQ